MSTNYDIITFLEYYADRASVVSGGLRTPTKQWQNFFQEGQKLGSADTESNSTYYYLPLEAQGFGSTEGSSINDFQVSLAATAELIDVTDGAMTEDNLVIASLYVQTAGSSSFDPSSAQRISRYIGTLDTASITDIAITWKVNPAINKLKPQVPTRKITGKMLNRTNPGVQ
jgi:hypothetical protein